MLEVLSSGFPHSDTRGSADMCSSPRLFAAYRVLLRLPVPRHPPCAFLHLTFSLHVLAYTCSSFTSRCALQQEAVLPFFFRPLKHSYVTLRFCLRISCVPSAAVPCSFLEHVHCVSRICGFQGAYRSHFGSSPLLRLVEMKGFEPLTPCLQGRCSPN